MKIISKAGVADLMYLIPRPVGGIDLLRTIRLTEEGTGRVYEYPDREVIGGNYQRMTVPNIDMVEGERYKIELIDQSDMKTICWEGYIYCTSDAGESFNNEGKYPHTINKDQYSVDKNDDNREYIILED